ncbi:lanthionine synthetase C family protein [Streptomyces sp. A0592]|uniref:lanthionine synthetase C family protein n=1 Tax=Streptomyces sp. A0592 TaxID=2563099 RepID=UPI00109ECCEB|nr:lanthionine synthetase C family protein [Streptomyces sp. A0592]THA83256.1 lanthionine synthetase [Streptomyces sp. A0592]
MSDVAVLPAALAARAGAVADLIGERLHTPALAAAAAVRAARQTDMSFWADASLSEGHAGLALLHLQAARSAAANGSGTGKKEFDRASAFVRAAFSATREIPMEHPGLFDGTAGLAFALQDVARDEPRFLPSLGRLHDQLARQVIATDWPRLPGAVADHHYDLVYGAAGIAVQLCSASPVTPVVEEALDRCLRHLVWVATDGHWAVDGRLDTGMSHGAAGITAALATAWRRGRRVPGQRAALDELATWLLDAGSGGGRGLRWTRTVPTDDGEAAPAWCHGTGGVAAGLLAVSRATGDRGLEEQAFAALDGLLDRVFAGDVPRSPTVCHGLAGLAVLAHEFAAHGSGGAARALPDLARRLVDSADPDLPLLYRDHETTGHIVDNPGLLTGAAGVALTLRALATGHRPGWWSVLLPQ